jgi:radical SAM superfamily enzyme YgiQ (UPF0313 family)
LNKRSDPGKIERAVGAIRAAGLRVVALLMFGNDGERPGSGARTARFLRALGVSHINPQLTVPYPGTELHRRLAAEGRIFSGAFDACNRRPIHFPDAIRPSQVVKEICGITADFLARRRVLARLALRADFQNWITRRGVIASGYLDRVRACVPELERIEADYYDGDHRLRRQLVRRHYESGLLRERVEEARALAPAL